MVKKIFVTLLLGLFLCGSFAPIAQAKELKLGYVDMQRIFTEYSRTKTSEAKLETEGKAKSDEREKMVAVVRRLKDEMELLSDKGKEEKQAQIDAKIKELQEFDRVARNQLGQQRENMIRDISKDIEKVITEYGKKEGYDLIFGKQLLLFQTETLDITEAILKTLNANAPKQ
ncbi:MAG: hypothetical protein COS99_01335 [Candidatus Omnitrophica bacterium CG07_land_8_20_14_0_80_42_15]|uniref:Molecular chaperone Skp n=1 Tax=Candidatus Aquitaenariimonas noxiae TaxID=1974741 RepID=A0A2J0L2E9_9BACT|nr:MAG: hypothetical protein COS99_01335 [Candidatus Omnitrophica bacterium CG07_land_8_20_14_0_80_42_15]